jgi:hypothetical protein
VQISQHKAYFTRSDSVPAILNWLRNQLRNQFSRDIVEWIYAIVKPQITGGISA